MRILPRHLRDLIHVSDISTDHRNLYSLSPMASNVAFIEVLKHWPLYGATFFDVTVSFSFKSYVNICTQRPKGTTSDNYENPVYSYSEKTILVGLCY